MIQEKRAQKDLSLSAANNATKFEKERLKKMVEERRRKQVEKNRGEVDMSVNVSAIQGETTGR